MAGCVMLTAFLVFLLILCYVPATTKSERGGEPVLPQFTPTQLATSGRRNQGTDSECH